ncbi:unannotated protein [freshwater metagenome]|uniref:Unannotated protein n=1 Tax=freshwater metagenome TaxID=449393 RepID=A0A6J7JY63_9ZZZZ
MEVGGGQNFRKPFDRRHIDEAQVRQVRPLLLKAGTSGAAAVDHEHDLRSGFEKGSRSGDHKVERL